MKLHWSPRSPFVRKVMIVAHETGLVGKIECVRTVASRTKINPALLEDSPVGRIPVLVLDDDTVLVNSISICEYLDTLHKGKKIIPDKNSERWKVMEVYGVADGFLDTLLLWRNEINLPEEKQTMEFNDTCLAKSKACLNWLEERVSVFSRQDYNIAHITVGVALDYFDFRILHMNWREGRPQLEAWHKTFIERPSSKATQIIDD